MTSSSGSSITTPLTPTTQFLIQEILKEFAGQGLTLTSLVSTAVAVTQSVMKSIIDASGPRITAVVEILKVLATDMSQTGELTPAQISQLLEVIDSVIPQLVATMTQIEQGCIVLCDESYTEIVQEASKCWLLCKRLSCCGSGDGKRNASTKTSSSSTVTKLPIITETNTVPPSSILLRSSSSGSSTIAAAQPITPKSGPPLVRVGAVSNLLHQTIAWGPVKTLPGTG